MCCFREPFGGNSSNALNLTQQKTLPGAKMPFVSNIDSELNNVFSPEPPDSVTGKNLLQMAPIRAQNGIRENCIGQEPIQDGFLQEQGSSHSAHHVEMDGRGSIQMNISKFRWEQNSGTLRFRKITFPSFSCYCLSF